MSSLSLSLSLSLVLCVSVLFRARVLFWRRRWWFFSLSRIYLFSSSFSKKKISSRNLFWHLWVKSTNNGFFLARWDFLFFFCKTRTKKRGIWRRRRRRRESLSLSCFSDWCVLACGFLLQLIQEKNEKKPRKHRKETTTLTCASSSSSSSSSSLYSHTHTYYYKYIYDQTQRKHDNKNKNKSTLNYSNATPNCVKFRNSVVFSRVQLQQQQEF